MLPPQNAVVMLGQSICKCLYILIIVRLLSMYIKVLLFLINELSLMSRGEAKRVKKMDNAKKVDVKVSLYILFFDLERE